MERSNQLCVLFWTFLATWLLLFNGSNGSYAEYAKFEIFPPSPSYLASQRLISWFQNRTSNPAAADDWSHELHRTATALFAGEKFFMWFSKKDEIAYKLTIQLLINLSSSKPLSSQELALYINGLVAVCIDPKNFHGRDLVSNLRAMVETERYTNPIEIIALCNAGDTMTEKDVERMMLAYNLPRRSFWKDTQALAVIALSCVFSEDYMSVNQTLLRNMVTELPKRQELTRLIDNIRTTALVLQAISAAKAFINSTQTDIATFNNGMKAITDQLDNEVRATFLDFYYILPALAGGSLQYSKSIHKVKCWQPKETEVLKKVQEQEGERIQVGYSVLIGNDFDSDREWKLKVPLGSSLYNVMETVQELDLRYKIEYNKVGGKPYPNAMLGYQNDPDTDLYWFVYKRAPETKVPELVESSPVDVKIKENEVLILWYKNVDWNSQENLMESTTRIEFPVTTFPSIETLDDTSIV